MSQQELALISNTDEVVTLKNLVTEEKITIRIKDIPINNRKKNHNYVFKIDDTCKLVKEIIIEEGFVGFEVDDSVKGTEFNLEKISFPSTISMTSAIPKLLEFNKLMFVYMKPVKKIQVKFSKPRFILCNLKKKKKDGLFYVYSSNAFGSSYEGITYISQFKEDKLVHFENGYYYLVETDQGKAYRFLRTDDVETFNIPKNVKGIPVKYLDPACLTNIKNNPISDADDLRAQFYFMKLGYDVLYE